METLTKPPEQLQDLNSLNKLEFENIDPRFSDIAYHFTPEENLAGIEQEGLKYSSEMHQNDKWHNADQSLMEAKPADIHVDLEHIVFGQLEQRHLGTSNGVGALRTNIEEGESLSVAVDPHDTYVGDAYIREAVTHNYDGVGQQLKEEFWKNVMPLAEFRELYEPDRDGEDYVSWMLKDPANKEKLGIQDVVSKPELYIPLEAGYDTIPTERLAHTASSLKGRVESAEDVRKREENEEQQKVDAGARAQVAANLQERQRQYEDEKTQRELARQEKEVAEQAREERKKHLGSIGLQLAEMYEEHVDAVVNGNTELYNRNLEDASKILNHKLAAKHVLRDAIRDANAAGHEINYGGEHHQATKEAQKDSNAA